jgi:hypothetical protein
MFATDFIDLGAVTPSPYQKLPANTSPVLDGGGPGQIIRPLVSMVSIPVNVVRVLACDDGSLSYTIAWERNGGKIYCEDTAQLLAKVVQLIEDPNLWSPNFAFVVAYKLASIIGPIITQSAKIESAMFEKYEAALKKARALDGAQGSTTQKLKIKSESLANRRA